MSNVLFLTVDGLSSSWFRKLENNFLEKQVATEAELGDIGILIFSSKHELCLIYQSLVLIRLLVFKWL